MENKFTLTAVVLALMVFLLSSCATGVSQEEYNKVSDELAVARAQIRSLEESQAELKRQLSEAKQNLESLNSQLLAIQSERDRLKTEVAALRKQLSSTPTPTPTPTPTATVKLRGGQYLVAQDGTYLGVLHSEFASKSILNDFGRYGSEFSSLSAFNDLASKPPMLFDGDNFICYVTTNTLKMPRVSPYSLSANP